MAFTSRSAAARDAILAAARRQFGADGFERTTVRSVATEAAVDPAMVMRYYGSKEGLFASAVEIDLRLPDPAGISRSELGATLANRFVELWEAPTGQPALQILLRSAGTTPAAQQRARNIFDVQVRTTIGATLRAADPAPAAADRADLVSARVGSYILGTAMVRYILKFGPIAGLGRADLAVEMAGVLQGLIDSG